MRAPFTPSPAFVAAKAQHEALCLAHDRASDALRSVPGIGTGSMGLTPDHVRATAAYRTAKAAYDLASAAMRDHAQSYVRTFKRELAAERAERMANGTYASRRNR